MPFNTAWPEEQAEQVADAVTYIVPDLEMKQGKPLFQFTGWIIQAAMKYLVLNLSREFGKAWVGLDFFQDHSRQFGIEQFPAEGKAQEEHPPALPGIGQL